MKDRRADLGVGRKGPAWIWVAEAFLVFLMAVYVAKLCILGMALLEEDPGIYLSWNLLFFGLEIFMLFVTADSLLGLSSRRPAGWKKAARGSFLLAVFTVLGAAIGPELSASGLVTFDPRIVIPIVLAVMAVLLLPSVRAYYVPPMESKRPLSAWAAFAAFSELYPSGGYRIRYEDERGYPDEQKQVRHGLRSLFGRFRSDSFP